MKINNDVALEIYSKMFTDVYTLGKNIAPYHAHQNNIVLTSLLHTVGNSMESAHCCLVGLAPCLHVSGAGCTQKLENCSYLTTWSRELFSTQQQLIAQKGENKVFLTMQCLLLAAA